MTNKDAKAWADHLAHHWEQRAQSGWRDWFVAPQGWGSDEDWNAHGEQTVDVLLTGLTADWLAGQDILEIGCGSGRLAQFLAPRGRSYTGVDIAPSMVEEAQRRCADLDADTRFAVTGGLQVPDAVRDRRYGVIVSIAVFIHCPAEVVESNLTDAWNLLTDDGVLRFQVGADASDHEGLQSMAGAELGHQNTEAIRTRKTCAPVEDPPADETLHDAHYMGHPYRYRELGETGARIFGKTPDLFRNEFACIYASVNKSDT